MENILGQRKERRVMVNQFVQRFMQWFRQQGRALQVGVGCGAVIALCACCTVGSAALGETGVLGGASVNARATATTQTTQTTQTHTSDAPTATLAASPTKTPATTATTTAPAAAVLGSPGQAFITRYGPLTNQSDQTRGDLHFQEYPGVALDYLIVDEGRYYGVTPGDTAAYSILVAAPPGQPWTLVTAKQTCTAFMPPDAQQVKQITTTGGSGAVTGWDTVYTSATLARTFPASAFQDASQNTVPTGSFDTLYLYASSSDTAHVVSCDLLVGEQQTQG